MRSRPEPKAERVVRRALIRFTTLSVVALALVMGATVLIAEGIAQGKALDDARTQGSGIARRLAAPLVDADVRAGLPGSASQLTLVMDNRMRDGSVRHVNIWDDAGVIIWSDDSELVGRTFELSADVRQLFGTYDATAGSPDHGAGEAAAIEELGRDDGVLEVYAGAFDDSGEPVVVETYLSTAPMKENAGTIKTAFVPLIAGSLLLLLLMLLPLAVSLSRRVERAQAERATMVRHAVLASDLERRRIVDELHQGVVQELAGLGYALPSLTRHLETGDLGAARSLVERATDLLEHNVASLRTLMTDLYPPDLESGGLLDAVRQLVRAEADQAAMTSQVRIEADLELAPEAARLAYRVIREGLHNVVKHAGAEEVLVEVVPVSHDVVVRVLDDGRGPGERPGHSPRGHHGLRLLDDTVRDVGGRLDVRARPGGGTVLEARFPADLVEP